MRLEVHFTDKKGNDKKGNAEADFDAKGFGPGCDPENLPPVHASAPGDGERAKKAAPRRARPSDKPSEKPSASTSAASEPAEQHDGDEGSVVPPPKGPGYAP